MDAINESTEVIVVDKSEKSPETIKPKYHSEMEERLVTDLKKVNLDVAKKELDNRIVVQHTSNLNNIECFNALAKNVLIRDENGKRVIIDNHEELKKIQRKNSKPTDIIVDDTVFEVVEENDDFEFDD